MTDIQDDIQRRSGSTEQSSPKAAAFFDVDHTLIDCSTEMHLAVAVFRQTSIPKFDAAIRMLKVVTAILLYKLNISKDLINLKRKSYRAILEGCTQKELEDCFQQVFRDDLVNRFFPESIELLQDHQSKGHKVVLVSGSMEIVIDFIGKHLNVDRCYSTKLVMENGVCTGEIDGLVVMSQNKSTFVKEYAEEFGINLANCFAYGDHWDDRHMLGLTGHPVAVNPDGRLIKFAKEKNWEVKDYKG